MTRRWAAVTLALGPLLGALAFACGSGRADFDRGVVSPPRGIVLVHAAAFPSFRLCFENYPELRPQPDSKVMPNANVVGVEVGSVTRIDPLARAPGRVFVIDRGEVEATVGSDEPNCGSLICDREAGALGDECLEPGRDYDEIAPILKPLGIGHVELLAIAGCANGIVLQNLGVDSSTCGAGWQFKSGNLNARVLELSSEPTSLDRGLPVQLVHLSPALEAARAGGSLDIRFGPLADSARSRSIAQNPPLFGITPLQTLDVDRTDPSFYGTYGFRVALSGRDAIHTTWVASRDAGTDADAGEDGGSDAGTSIVVAQSLAEVQDLSAPRDVPADYYRAASSYVLLLVGDPSIEETFEDGGPNPNYSPRRGLHLLTLPVLDPNAGADGGDGFTPDGSNGGPR